jgi:phage shock protein A
MVLFAFVLIQKDRSKIRQTYAEVTATQRRLGQQKNLLETTADDWYRRAELALRSRNEGLARAALARREQVLSEASNIQYQIDGQASNIDKLYEGMMALENRISEAKMKQTQMAARARTAKSTVTVNDMLSGATGKTSMDAFKRMEDKVEALEVAAEASAGMSQSMLYSLSPNPATNTNVEMEFLRLESSAAVEEALQKMQAAMFLPEAGSSTGRTD